MRGRSWAGALAAARRQGRDPGALAGNVPLRRGGPLGPVELLEVQRLAGNQAVQRLLASPQATPTVQRAGGWKGADKTPGKGLDPNDPKTGWNVEEHAVGTIRRIPLDGLTVGLQDQPEESASAKELSNEHIAGPVNGPARCEPAELLLGAVAAMPALARRPRRWATAPASTHRPRRRRPSNPDNRTGDAWARSGAPQRHQLRVAPPVGS